MSTNNEAKIRDEDNNEIKFIDQNERNMLIYKLRSNISKGECVELIDGENLDFKGEIAQMIFNDMKKSNILSIVVIGR